MEKAKLLWKDAVPARVLVIGFDAASEALISRWAAEGHLPAFSQLGRRAATARLVNSLDRLPGAIWPELETGRSVGQRPQFHHLGQFRTGAERYGRIGPEDIETEDYYWTVASRAGRRVAVVDLPQVAPARRLDGVQVLEWSPHDMLFPAAVSDPPHLLDELRSRHGSPPSEACETHGGTYDGYLGLLAALVKRVENKTEILLDLLGRESWDLFTCAFTEAHCVGHHFWHFMDPSHPRHDPDAPEELRHAMRTVYRELDRALARLLQSAGREVRILVLASHGMGPLTGGGSLVPDVLHRLGMSGGRPPRVRLAPWVPLWLRDAIRRASRGLLPYRLKLGFDVRFARPGGPRSRAFAVYNHHRCGAIRLNLAGRDPHGSVRPGPEAEALLEELRGELLALRDPASGQPIVEQVISAEEAFGPDHHPDIPDLMVAFRTDLGSLDACQSPRVGLVRSPYDASSSPRSGDHTPESRLWALGCDLPGGSSLPDGNVLDVAPTVLRLLGVDAPSGLDGKPLDLWPSRREGAEAALGD